MIDVILKLLAISLYGFAGILVWRWLSSGGVLDGRTRGAILALGAAGATVHAILLYGSLGLGTGVNLALTTATSLIAWVLALLFLLTMLKQPIESLGIVILPLAGLTILVHWLWPGTHFLSSASSVQSVHVVISLLAYALLSLGGVQSILLLIQERHLRRHHPGGFIRALPPLQTMESLMVGIIELGFILLTLTLISGLFFSEAIFGKPLTLTHHTLLATLSWLVFAVFLLGRWRFGWRGRTAVRWVLGGCILLALAYFGTKFVLEVLLGR